MKPWIIIFIFSLLIGCNNNSGGVVSSQNNTLSLETDPYKLAIMDVKANNLEKADKLLMNEIENDFLKPIDTLPINKQNMVNLRYYILVKQSVPNDYENALNYLRQLKPIEELITKEDIEKMIIQYTPLAEEQTKKIKVNNEIKKQNEIADRLLLTSYIVHTLTVSAVRQLPLIVTDQDTSMGKPLTTAFPLFVID